MKASLIIFFIFFSVSGLMSGQIQASNDLSLFGPVPEIKIFPTSPFYGVKQWLENLGDFFTIGQGRQAVRNLEIAQKRLWESKFLLEAKPDRATETTALFNKYLQRIQSGVRGIQNLSNDAAIQKYLPPAERLLQQHKVTLEEITQVAPQTLLPLWGQGLNYLDKYTQSFSVLKGLMKVKLNEVVEKIKQQEQLQQDIEQGLKKRLPDR